MKIAMLFVPALLALAAPATAAIVYDNGAPLGTNGNESTAWVQAESFTLGTAQQLTGAGVYLAGFDGIGAYDGGFQYYIFADSGGIPGAILQTGSVTPTITDTGTPWDFGGNIFLFTFDFASTVNAAAGVTYFLGFHASGVGDFNRDDIYWVDTAPNATDPGVESFGGTFDNWASNGLEHAFYLEGGVIPEPASWALMIVGFGLVGFAARRRRVALAA